MDDSHNGIIPVHDFYFFSALNFLRLGLSTNSGSGRALQAATGATPVIPGDSFLCPGSA